MKKRIAFLFAFVTINLFAQDLLLHYPFDGNANDLSGNNYNGSLFGTSFGVDRFNNPNSAIYLDGIDDYIAFPNISELKPDLPISFSFWVKYDDLTYENSTVFNTSFEEDVNSGLYMNVQGSTGRYQISYGDGSNFYSPASRRTYASVNTIDADDWHHIVIIVNSGTDMQIYVDCVESGGDYSGTGGSLQYSNLPGNIGRHDRSLSAPADYFKGAVDDFKYWNRELTLEEISNLCNSLSIEDTTEKVIRMYPNPTKGVLFFEETSQNIETIDIYNVQGQKVVTTKFTNRLDLGDLPAGFYFIELKNALSVQRQKIIIQ